jgi:hypothetical protein
MSDYYSLNIIWVALYVYLSDIKYEINDYKSYTDVLVMLLSIQEYNKKINYQHHGDCINSARSCSVCVLDERIRYGNILRYISIERLNNYGK